MIKARADMLQVVWGRSWQSCGPYSVENPLTSSTCSALLRPVLPRSRQEFARHLVQGILDNQCIEEPDNALEHENSRLLQLVAELRQKMSALHEEHAATVERINGQVCGFRAQACLQACRSPRMSDGRGDLSIPPLFLQMAAAKAEAQQQKKLARDSHAHVLQGLIVTSQKAEALQTTVEKCREESARSKIASEARHGMAVRKLREAEARESDVLHRLREQQVRTRSAEAAAAELHVRVQEMEVHNKDLASRIVLAETDVQQLGALLEKTGKKLSVFIAGHSKGNDKLAGEVARLLQELKNVSIELIASQKTLAEKNKLADDLADELARLSPNLKRAQEAAERALRENHAIASELGAVRGKLEEVEAMCEARMAQVAAEKARADELEVCPCACYSVSAVNFGPCC
jgi:hypothetical protein